MTVRARMTSSRRMPKLMAIAATLGFLSTMGITVGAASASPAPAWRQLSPATSPSARSYVAMAEDPATSQDVEFGGQVSPGTALGDTWIWNGITWSNAATTGPSPRYAASMAYDAQSGQLLLFGGASANGTPQNDTWVWGGTAWTQVNLGGTSPSPRYAAAMAYDPTTHTVILFGGDTVGGPLNDTWSWNGTTWSLLTPAGSPPARHSASLAYDPVSTNLILFAGCTIHQLQPCDISGVPATLGDTWSWNGTTWTQLTPATSPSARSGAAFATDTATDVNQAVLFGGETASGTALGDTWFWTGTNWVLQSLTPSPPARFAAGFAFDPALGGLLLFGGQDAALGDSWEFGALSTATTTTISSSLNPAKTGNAVVFTAQVAPIPDGGTVTIDNGGVPVAGCSGLTVTNGFASCTTSFGTAGTYTMTAVYSGDANFGGSTSAPLSEVVTPSVASSMFVGHGYWMAAADGGVFSFGDAQFYGSVPGVLQPGQHLNKPVVGIQGTGDTHGYWLVASDGGVFAFGDAQFYGSLANNHLNAPIVGITPTSDGKGYWMVASDGGVFAFGDAAFFGSVPGVLKPGQSLDAPITAIQSTNDGGGYWMVASDGGVFAFGDAAFYGSVPGVLQPGQKLNKPIVGVGGTPSKLGYWLVATDGGIFSFGNAKFFGSVPGVLQPGQVLNKPIEGIAANGDGLGYWLAASDGGVFSFGDAQFYGSVPGVLQPGQSLNAPIDGIALSR